MIDGTDASCTVQTFAPAPAVCSGPATPADLRLTKTVDRATYLIGQQLVFTITVFNDGPGSAMGVVVRDQLPLGVSLVSAVPSVGTYNNSTGQWLVGDMNANTSQTLIIMVTVVSTP